MQGLNDAIATAGAIVRSLYTPPPGERALQRHLAASAFSALARASAVPLLVAAVASAALVSTVLREQFTRFGIASFVPDALTMVIVRELVPVVASLVLLTRAAVAITAELASERVEGELDALDAMGHSSVALVLAPRTIALTILSSITMLVVTGVAIQTDLIITAWRGDTEVGRFGDAVRSTFSPLDPLTAIVLGAAVGAMLALAAILTSDDVRHPGDIPVATRRCASVGLVLLLLIHGVDVFFRHALL